MSTEEHHPSPELRGYATQEMLRAMAHPLRLQLMERVGRRGTARAADLAEEMGVAANALSYHLRTLAKAGVIEEAPGEARDRRDRVWRLTQASFHYGQGESSTNDPDATDDEYRRAAMSMSLAAIEWIRTSWIAQSARYEAGEASQNLAGQLFSSSLRISRDQAEDLARRANDLIMEFNRLNRDERGTDLEGDPDSEGPAEDFRVLFALVGDRPAPDQRMTGGQEDSHTPEG
ncbi:helix-turn-helix transcriptional regulator [Brachybacterium sp. MASK1Z-5]|uniref:Helix-turn-helix transcriptional regulator n=1 Tax=Brachybacterium halotolerans TaxID=2795215 RepID=A0ABS1B766_9MICO|nr:helix-turn-helix domain-containing protein [Brachybacterium halotolerans]MBK0330482.1 helix-turn-helix transcriptional regulator [Brachybacterium halotolerans]